MPVAVEPLCALPVEVIGGDKIVHLRRIVALEDGRVEARGGTDGRLLTTQSIPEPFDRRADGCDGTDSCYHYSPLRQSLSIRQGYAPGVRFAASRSATP